MNIKQQKTAFINCFSTNNASGEGISSSSTIETLGFSRFTWVWMRWPVLGVAVSDPAGRGTPGDCTACTISSLNVHPADTKGVTSQKTFIPFTSHFQVHLEKVEECPAPQIISCYLYFSCGAVQVFKSESKPRQRYLFKIPTSKFLFQNPCSTKEDLHSYLPLKDISFVLGLQSH